MKKAPNNTTCASAPKLLPVPGLGPEAATDWVSRHLADLAGDSASPSRRFRGGQAAAESALAAFAVEGYASRRNEVWPQGRRGASGLSPYIRHGLIPLRRVWTHVAGGPARDVREFRDELLWQEYARHLYARLGRDLVEIHPWPWLRRPHAGSLRSFSAWRKKADSAIG